jgi:hypothetical protein
MEAIEYRGLWWLPSNTNRKLAGVLTCMPSDEFKLELIGTFNEWRATTARSARLLETRASFRTIQP